MKFLQYLIDVTNYIICSSWKFSHLQKCLYCQSSESYNKTLYFYTITSSSYFFWLAHDSYWIQKMIYTDPKIIFRLGSIWHKIYKLTRWVAVDSHLPRTLANSWWLLQTHCLLLCSQYIDDCPHHCFIHLNI